MKTKSAHTGLTKKKSAGGVLETVKTWRFQPATINGKPVATEAELIPSPGLKPMVY